MYVCVEGGRWSRVVVGAHTQLFAIQKCCQRALSEAPSPTFLQSCQVGAISESSFTWLTLFALLVIP